MTSLREFQAHCAKLAAAEHKPECPSLPANQPYWPMWSPVHDGGGRVEALRWNGPPPPAPTCDGCNSAEDRALFARLAGEVQAYLAVDLFGTAAHEPGVETAAPVAAEKWG